MATSDAGLGRTGVSDYDAAKIGEADLATEVLISSTQATLGLREDGNFAAPHYDADVVAQSNLAVARAVQALGLRLEAALDALAAHLGPR